MFIWRGISTSDADDLAERLVLRDRDDDDRVLCVECKHGRATHCPEGSPQPPEVLHGCDGFNA